MRAARALQPLTRPAATGGWWRARRALHAHAQQAQLVSQGLPTFQVAAHQDTNIILREGGAIPKLGLSTFLTPPGEATRGAVSHALSEGYRHIDTSELFKNERDVGAAIQGSGVTREDVFITTRYWHAGGATPVSACRASMKRLGVDSVDAYLMYPPKGETLMLKVWEAMQGLEQAGLAKHVGLSLATLSEVTAIVRAKLPIPRIIQAPVCPFSPQRELLALCAELGVHVSSLSPLGGGLRLENTVVGGVARGLGARPSQVMIAWGLRKGLSCVPKSSSAAHISENWGALGLELSEGDMHALDAIRPRPDVP